MVETRMGLARRLQVAKHLEQSLVVREHDAHAEPDPERPRRRASASTASINCFARPWPRAEGKTEAAEIEISSSLPSARSPAFAVPLRDDHAGAPSISAAMVPAVSRKSAGFVRAFRDTGRTTQQSR